MKDYLRYQGKTEIYGLRKAIKEAFYIGLIDDGETHTYDEKTAEEILNNIVNKYYFVFKKVEEKIEIIRKKENYEIGVKRRRYRKNKFYI